MHKKPKKNIFLFILLKIASPLFGMEIATQSQSKTELTLGNKEKILIPKETFEQLKIASAPINDSFSFSLQAKSGDNPQEINLPLLTKNQWTLTEQLLPLFASKNDDEIRKKIATMSAQELISLLVANEYLDLNSTTQLKVSFETYKTLVEKMSTQRFLTQYAESPFRITAPDDSPVSDFLPQRISLDAAKGIIYQSEFVKGLFTPPTRLIEANPDNTVHNDRNLLVVNNDGSCVMATQLEWLQRIANRPIGSTSLTMYNLTHNIINTKNEPNSLILSATFDTLNNKFLVIKNEYKSLQDKQKDITPTTAISIFSEDGKWEKNFDITPNLKSSGRYELHVTQEGNESHLIVISYYPNNNPKITDKYNIYTAPWSVNPALELIPLAMAAKDRNELPIFSKDFKLVTTRPSLNHPEKRILTNLITGQVTNLSNFPSDWNFIPEKNSDPGINIRKFSFSLDMQLLIPKKSSKNREIYSLQNIKLLGENSLYDQLVTQDDKEESLTPSRGWLFQQKDEPPFSVFKFDPRNDAILAKLKIPNMKSYSFSGDGKKIVFYSEEMEEKKPRHAITVADVSILNAISKMISQKKFFVEHLLLVTAALSKTPILKMHEALRSFYQTLEPELQRIVDTAYASMHKSERKKTIDSSRFDSFITRFFRFLAPRLVAPKSALTTKTIDTGSPAAPSSDSDNDLD